LVNDVLEGGPVLITPTALVVAKSPVLLHGREPRSALMIGLCNIFSRRARIEVQVKAATKRPPSNARGPEEYLLGMCISEEDTVRVGDVLGLPIVRVSDIGELSRFDLGEISCIEIYRVASVDIGIGCITNISSEDRS
jgi:hypothetical protein